VRNGTLTFPAGMEGTVSVFSSGDAARGVTLRGLLYEVTDATLTCAMPLGVSNSFTGAEASVHVADGTVFVLWQGDALPDGLEVCHGAD
jgi:thiamine pyrophosphokinase